MANPQKEDGHIDIANDIAETLAKTQLTGYESRVIWAIWRKTWGWVKKKNGKFVKDKKGNIVKLKKASFSQEDWEKLTGLHINNVYRTLKRLESRKIIIKFDKNIWGFQKDYDEWLSLNNETIKNDSEITIKNDSETTIKNDSKISRNDSKIIKNDSKNPSNSLSLKKKPPSKEKKKEKKENNNNKKRKFKQKKEQEKDWSDTLELDLAKNLALRIISTKNEKAMFCGYGKKAIAEMSESVEYRNWCEFFHGLIGEWKIEDLEFYTKAMDWCLREEEGINPFWFNAITQGQAKTFCEKFGIIRDQMDAEDRMRVYKQGDFFEGNKLGELTRDEISDPPPKVDYIDRYIKEPYQLSWFKKKPRVVESWLKDIKERLGDKFEEWYEKCKDEIGEHDINQV